MIAIGTLTQNTEPQEKWFEQDAADHRADGHAEAGEAGPHGDRPAALARVAEHVGQDRQGGGHDQRAADAHQAAGGDQLVRRARQRRQHRADGEDDDAGAQRQLAAEAVAEAAGGEQQAGEHEGVAVDDPLDLAVGRPELVDQLGDRHVEDRVVHHDDQQADAQRAEGEPAPGVDRAGRARRGPRRTARVGLSFVAVMRRSSCSGRQCFRYGTVPYCKSARAGRPPCGRRHMPARARLDDVEPQLRGERQRLDVDPLVVAVEAAAVLAAVEARAEQPGAVGRPSPSPGRSASR